MKVEIVRYHALASGSLKGIFTLVIHDWGQMQIEGCKHFETTLGSSWFKFPDKQGPVNEKGKAVYYNIIKLHQKSIEKKLQEQVLVAIESFKSKVNNGKKTMDTKEAFDSQAVQAENDLLSGDSSDLW